jgi:alkylated DNA repair dioxygenase AlkB
MSPDGSEMTVERVVIVQHGYTLRGTRNYATVKDVFARANP